jgi:hypothetical protein
MNEAYKQLTDDLHTLLHNASVEAGCAARDMYLALTNPAQYDAIKKSGTVPVSDIKAMRALDNVEINALLDLRNQLEIEANEVERR